MDIRGIDNYLLSYRYDIAFNFNDYGLAIVYKDGQLSWINSDFCYIDLMGQIVKIEYEFFADENNISAFSKGDIPLSRLDLSYKDLKNIISRN